VYIFINIFVSQEGVFNLIKALKIEHSAIIDNLEETKRLGVYSKEGQDVIFSIQMNILSHLEKEDKELYPVLKDAVKSERKVNDTLNLFDENISAVSNTVIHFFENYARKAENQLAMETEWLIEALTWRIQREESLIFAMYEGVH
jgi:hemerythrin-like domain-containing protein